MSNPAQEAAATQEKQATNEPTFADAVNEAVNKAEVDNKGNLVLPEGLSEEVKYAATLEKRRRDTQSTLSKVTQRSKALDKEKSVLLSKAIGATKVELTEAQTEELEDLKFSDPEAYRHKMNSYESAARTKASTELDEELKKVSKSSLDEEELSSRKQILEEFNRTNDVNFDDDLIANDIPPRILKKLETGAISFSDFLQECLDYTKTGKVIKQEKALEDPNLNKVAGGNKPGDTAVKEDIIKSYEKETY